MDRWKAEMGRGREKRRIEECRSEKRKSQKKEDADARKGRKVAKQCVFPMICGSGGSKSKLAKAAGAEPSGQMRDEKVHAVVARSAFPSQNVQNTPGSDHFWKLRCRESARHCGPKHISKSKCIKHFSFGALLEVTMSINCTPLWREAHFEVKMYKAHQVRTTFGHLKRICKDAFSVAGAIQETFSLELLGGQGADFLRGVAFWSIRSSGLLRWFRVTGTALRMTWHHFFVAGAVLMTGGLEKSQNELVRGRQRCSQLSIFEGSLAQLLRFWCCQVWKMKKSRRIALFLTLLNSKIEEVWQNCFVFDVLKFKK